MAVAQNIMLCLHNPTLVSVERLVINVAQQARARSVVGCKVFSAVADEMEVIPRTLAQNAGGNLIRILIEFNVRKISSSSG
ncbi:hypothetical protein BU17DRAFT_41596 [Hysterangium stoloniferum]|nr:hypothetical protein BU17DRAFT_41596 [Hysterangium stoloniferum]